MRKLFILIFIIMAACEDEPKSYLSNEPEIISFHSSFALFKDSLLGNELLTAVHRIEYLDGDVNVGEDVVLIADTLNYNALINSYVKRDGIFVEDTTTIPSPWPEPYLANPNPYKIIIPPSIMRGTNYFNGVEHICQGSRGKISIIQYFSCGACIKTDSMKFDVKIIDRENNESNIFVTKSAFLITDSIGYWD